MSLAAGPLAAGNLAFVTCQNGNALSVLDLEAGEERDRWEVPGKPAGVAVTAEGSVYTVSPDDKTVRRFGSDGALIAAVTLEGGPIGITLDAARGRIFVTDWYNAHVWVLSSDLALQTTLDTGAAPAGLALSPDGRWLASADKDADQVSIFDAESLALHHRVGVGARPFGLRFAPDGRLFVGNVGSDDVSVLDPVSGETLATPPVGDRPYGVAFTQGRAFVTDQYADTVSVIALDSLQPIGKIDVGEYPEGIDVTADGATVVVANWFENSVTLIDPLSMQAIGSIDTCDGPRAFGTFLWEETE